MNKVLTANRLTDGIAVWLGSDGRWSDTIDKALVARHDEAVASLDEIGAAAVSDNAVIDVAVIDVEEVAGRIVPVRMREKIRAAGPTIRPDLGKQAERDAALAA